MDVISDQWIHKANLWEASEVEIRSLNLGIEPHGDCGGLANRKRLVENPRMRGNPHETKKHRRQQNHRSRAAHDTLAPCVWRGHKTGYFARKRGAAGRRPAGPSTVIGEFAGGFEKCLCLQIIGQTIEAGRIQTGPQTGAYGATQVIEALQPLLAGLMSALCRGG